MFKLKITPVYQTRFGWPNGNCYAACVATITGIPLSEIDKYLGKPEHWEQWWYQLQRFLNDRGWIMVYVPFRDDNYYFISDPFGFPFYYIINGTSVKGLGHAAVGYRGKVVHNPNPNDNANIVETDGATLLIPITGSSIKYGLGPTTKEMEKIMAEDSIASDL